MKLLLQMVKLPTWFTETWKCNRGFLWLHKKRVGLDLFSFYFCCLRHSEAEYGGYALDLAPYTVADCEAVDRHETNSGTEVARCELARSQQSK